MVSYLAPSAGVAPVSKFISMAASQGYCCSKVFAVVAIPLSILNIALCPLKGVGLFIHKIADLEIGQALTALASNVWDGIKSVLLTAVLVVFLVVSLFSIKAFGLKNPFEYLMKKPIPIVPKREEVGNSVTETIREDLHQQINHLQAENENLLAQAEGSRQKTASTVIELDEVTAQKKAAEELLENMKRAASVSSSLISSSTQTELIPYGVIENNEEKTEKSADTQLSEDTQLMDEKDIQMQLIHDLQKRNKHLQEKNVYLRDKGAYYYALSQKNSKKTPSRVVKDFLILNGPLFSPVRDEDAMQAIVRCRKRSNAQGKPTSSSSSSSSSPFRTPPTKRNRAPFLSQSLSRFPSTKKIPSTPFSSVKKRPLSNTTASEPINLLASPLASPQV